MPTNLYGRGDNYHPENSHVIPGLMHRFHEAKGNREREIKLWGTGTPRREFLHVDDLAEAVNHLLRLDDPPDWVNVGYGTDVTIRELADEMRAVTGYEGELAFDPSKPDGPPRKLLDSSKIRASGWEPQIHLREGLAKTYTDYLRAREDGSLRQVR